MDAKTVMVAGFNEAHDEITRLRAERDELVWALKRLVTARDTPHGFPDLPWYEPAFDGARALLAKIGEGGK